MKALVLSCISLMALTSVSTLKANDFEAALSQETAQFTFRAENYRH